VTSYSDVEISAA